MRFSTKGAGIAVTVIFATAATFVPLPLAVSWRPLAGSLAWIAVILSCYVYVEAHVDSLARFRHKIQKTYPVLMLSIVFLACGCLGVGVFALFKASEPKADTVATTEPPDSAKNSQTLPAKSRGRQTPPAPTHINTFTASEIHKELEMAGPLERDEVAEQFRHGIVDWTLIFDGDLIRPRGTNSMTVRFLPVNSPYPKITCPDIKVEGNAYLGRIRSPVRFRVRGVIGDVDLSTITLHEATFEQFPDAAGTPVPETSPKAVPSPTATRQQPTPTATRRPVKKFTPREIQTEMSEAGPLERKEVGESFIGGLVDWTLMFSSVHGSRGDKVIQANFSSKDGFPPTIICEGIPLNGNEYLGGIKSPAYFRVRGVIVRAEVNTIVLHEVTVEQLPDYTPTPAREAGPAVVPPKNITAAETDVGPRVVPPNQGNAKERADKAIQTVEARMKEINSVMEKQGPLLDFLAENNSLPITKAPEVPKLFEVEADLIQECIAIEKETGWIAFRDLATYLGGLNSNILDFNKVPSARIKNKILVWTVQNIPRMILEAKQQAARPPS